MLTEKKKDLVASSDKQYKRSSGSWPKGFSLWELIIVVAVVGVLAAVTIPQFASYRQKAARQPSILAAVDSELAKLEWQQMVYTAPDRMEIGSTATVNVALGGNMTFAELALLLEKAGKAEGQRVQVADQMEARLTGSGLDIVANTPEIQPISTIQATSWQWQVKAKDLGKQKLFLSLNALLSVGGQSTKKSIRTFQREISVEVTSISGTWAFAERYWTYLALVFTAIIIPVSVSLLKRLNRRSEANPQKMPKRTVLRAPRKRRR
ncbi:MAG: prepilin-type N-terminal cleavage/methylation domain-containing protein [Desulfobacteraceae bacterium]|nr:MAG: prepilin-type N-terminal cleavage/methylation domain-containing protein [Desulfobacteraceae bacterium]